MFEPRAPRRALTRGPVAEGPRGALPTPRGVPRRGRSTRLGTCARCACRGIACTARARTAGRWGRGPWSLGRVARGGGGQPRCWVCRTIRCVHHSRPDTRTVGAWPARPRGTVGARPWRMGCHQACAHGLTWSDTRCRGPASARAQGNGGKRTTLYPRSVPILIGIWEHEVEEFVCSCSKSHPAHELMTHGTFAARFVQPRPEPVRGG